MTLRTLLQKRKSDVLRIAERHGAHNVRIFGSVMREEERSESDIDFLVTLDEEKGLFDIMHLEEELTHLLHRKAQVVTDDALNPHFRASILQEAVPL